MASVRSLSVTKRLFVIVCSSVFSFVCLQGPSAYSGQDMKMNGGQPGAAVEKKAGDLSAQGKKDADKASSGKGEQEAAGPCEVVSFDAYEESQAVLTPSGEYTVTARRECANVTVRNISGSARSVGDFSFTAVLGDGKAADGRFDSAKKDSGKSIFPGDTYSGITCFEGGSPIVILNCAVE